MSLFSLDGKVAVITGSSRGIGKAIAERLAEHGARVVISSRKAEPCQQVAAAINDRFGAGRAISIPANISKKDDLRNLGAQDAQERMSQAIQYLDTHFAESIDVSVISPKFGYTREHFTRLFRRRKGISPGQYLQDLRFMRACELLRATDLSLDAIAEKSGLGSASYLCRQFQRKLRLSPGDYRKSHDAASQLP